MDDQAEYILEARTAQQLKSEDWENCDMFWNSIQQEHKDDFSLHPAFLKAHLELENKNAHIVILHNKQNQSSFLIPYIKQPLWDLSSNNIMKIWTSHYGHLTMPFSQLLTTLDQSFGKIAEYASKNKYAALRIPFFLSNTSNGQKFREFLQNHDLDIATINQFERANWHRDWPQQVITSNHKSSGKHRTQNKKHWQRLENLGFYYDHSKVNVKDVEDVSQLFLMLESKSWKGNAGTALRCNKDTQKFFNSIMQQLAKNSQVTIDRISSEQQTIAMMVNFHCGGNVTTWKGAFDPEFSSYSPGKLLYSRTVESFKLDDDVNHIDSLTTANHPMINTILQHRLTVSDIIIRFPHTSKSYFDMITRNCHLKNNIYQTGKGLIKKILKK